MILKLSTLNCAGIALHFAFTFLTLTVREEYVAICNDTFIEY